MIDKYFMNIIRDVSKELNIPINKVIKAYWIQYKFIKEKIGELDLSRNDITEEEFNKLKKSFNIPLLGKFNVSYDRYKGVKNRQRFLKEKAKDGRVQNTDD